MWRGVSPHVARVSKLVLQRRIELPTSPLPRECSTTELLQHPKPRRRLGVSGEAGRLLPHVPGSRKPRSRSFFRSSGNLSRACNLRYLQSFSGNNADGGRAMTSGTDERESRKRAKEALRREQEAEKKRLAGALRANLQRRKAQTRARREGEADERGEGLPGAGPQEQEKG